MALADIANKIAKFSLAAILSATIMSAGVGCSSLERYKPEEYSALRAETLENFKNIEKVPNKKEKFDKDGNYWQRTYWNDYDIKIDISRKEMKIELYQYGREKNGLIFDYNGGEFSIIVLKGKKGKFKVIEYTETDEGFRKKEGTLTEEGDEKVYSNSVADDGEILPYLKIFNKIKEKHIPSKQKKEQIKGIKDIILLNLK